jgi:hypothetical protein
VADKPSEQGAGLATVSSLFPSLGRPGAVSFRYGSCKVVSLQGFISGNGTFTLSKNLWLANLSQCSIEVIFRAERERRPS